MIYRNGIVFSFLNKTILYKTKVIDFYFLSLDACTLSQYIKMAE